MKEELFKTSKKIKEIKIALLSDIHYYPKYNKRILNKLYNQIKKATPDFICIAGDILDDAKYEDLESLIEWLNKISKISETIIVKGNHDEKTRFNHEWKYLNNSILEDRLKNNHQIHILNNETFTKKNITFYGIKLSYKYYEKDYESYNSFTQEINENIYLNDNNYNICLIHSPINIYDFIHNNPESNLNKIDLILSGHMHNSCLPLWLSNIVNKTLKTSKGLISPKCLLFPNYSQGRTYKIKDGYIYEGVSKLSKSTKILHNFDFIYHKQIRIIKIKQV